MKNFALALALSALAAAAQPMLADGVGTPITATLTAATSPVNLFDTNGPVILSSNTTFSYQKGFDSVTAILTGDNITVAYAGVGNFQATFSDPDLTGVSNVAVGDNLGLSFGSLDSFFANNTLTLDIQGAPLTELSAGVFTADLQYTTPNGGMAVTPEPSSMALFGTGLLGMAGVVRRRFQA